MLLPVTIAQLTDATFARLMDLDLREAFKAMNPRFGATHLRASQIFERSAPTCRASYRLVLCSANLMMSEELSGRHHLGHHAGQSSNSSFCQQGGSKLIGQRRLQRVLGLSEARPGDVPCLLGTRSSTRSSARLLSLPCVLRHRPQFGVRPRFAACLLGHDGNDGQARRGKHCG